MPAQPNAVRQTRGKSPRDLTGIRGQQLAKDAAARKAEETAQVTESLEAQRVAKLTTEVDYSSEARARAREAATSGVVEETEVEVRPRTRRIRVLDEIRDMTFGREVLREAETDEHGNTTRQAELGPLRTFNFDPGRWYTVDADLADHLAYLGYVYDE